MPDSKHLHLFEGFGIEIEYMIVGSSSLDVLPICDRVLHQAAGDFESEIERGDIAWSNELALHVLELKTNGPSRTFDTLPAAFGQGVRDVNAILEPMGGRLLPSGMHPWMNPFEELRLWPHEYNAVYEAFDRIFDCRGHGWANLQSMHLNLPFADDDEFGRLHAAIRLLLPILPALSASSPFMDGRATGFADSRLETYRTNSRHIPSVAGRIVPEPLYTRETYEKEILHRIYRDIAPHDPEGVLQHEFINARGAIARFDRFAIEIRVLDAQECPEADIAIAACVSSALARMIEEAPASLEAQRSWSVERLERIFLDVVRDGDLTTIRDGDYLTLLGLEAKETKAGDVWRRLLSRSAQGPLPIAHRFELPISVILDRGTLARRIIAAAGDHPSRSTLEEVYRELSRCLETGRMFVP